MLEFKTLQFMLFKASQSFFLLLPPSPSLGFIYLLRLVVISLAITESRQSIELGFDPGLQVVCATASQMKITEDILLD